MQTRREYDASASKKPYVINVELLLDTDEIGRLQNSKSSMANIGLIGCSKYRTDNCFMLGIPNDRVNIGQALHFRMQNYLERSVIYE